MNRGNLVKNIKLSILLLFVTCLFPTRQLFAYANIENRYVHIGGKFGLYAGLNIQDISGIIA